MRNLKRRWSSNCSQSWLSPSCEIAVHIQLFKANYVFDAGGRWQKEQRRPEMTMFWGLCALGHTLEPMLDQMLLILRKDSEIPRRTKRLVKRQVSSSRWLLRKQRRQSQLWIVEGWTWELLCNGYYQRIQENLTCEDYEFSLVRSTTLGWTGVLESFQEQQIFRGCTKFLTNSDLHGDFQSRGCRRLCSEPR